MIEKIMKKIKEKYNNEEQYMTFKLETVQGFFEMQDTNKKLKFNAITKEQLERVENFEENFNSIMKKLYVPDYQSENV